jgi:hypothetical protein
VPRLNHFVAVASGMAVVLLLGMLVGLTLLSGLGPAAPSEPSLSTSQVPPSQVQRPNFPRWQPKYHNARLSAVGPMTVMPALVSSSDALPAYPLMADTLVDVMRSRRTHPAP